MVTKTTATTKCDVRDCKNFSEFAFEIKGRQGQCFLCKECYEKLVAEGRKLLVPKSPCNTIKKKLDKRAEEQNYVEKQSN